MWVRVNPEVVYVCVYIANGSLYFHILVNMVNMCCFGLLEGNI